MGKEVYYEEVEIACKRERRLKEDNTFEEPKEAHIHGVQAGE